MKKTLLVITLVCAALGAVLGQEGAGSAAASTMADVGLLNAGNLESYSKLFLNGGGILSRKYTEVVSEEDYSKIAVLGERETAVDTPLEIALLSTCAGVVDVRPVEASNILGTAKQADLKLGSAVLKELTELKFLDPNNRDAVGRYEGILKFITDRGNVSRAEIESYYRQGIGSLIAETVDTEFNKIDFILDINSRMSYGCILARSANNQYVLSYKSYFGTDTESKRELSAASLDALVTLLSRSSDFPQLAINTVRANAALIPAVAIAQSGQTEAVQGTVKKALTDFYVSPTLANYNTVKDISALFMRRAWEYHQDPLFGIISTSYDSVLSELSYQLLSKVNSDANQEKYAASTLTQTQISDLTVRR